MKLNTNTATALGVSSVVLLAVCVVCVVCATSKPVLTEQKGLRHMKVLTNQPSEALIVPLWWDAAEDAFMIEVKLGQSWVACVFDTGCSSASAKGSTCHWTHCSEANDVCAVESCPGVGGKYVPAEDAVVDIYSDPRLTLGSQSSTGAVYVETVSFFDYRPSCAALAAAPQRFESAVGFYSAAAPAGLPLRRFPGCRVRRVTSITGGTSSNIFGMARAKSGRGGSSSLLESMAVGGVWSMYLGAESGFFSLSAMRCWGTPLYVPLVSPYTFRRFATHFYTVGIAAVEVGTQDGHFVPVVASTPKYLVLDTGTANTYGSLQFGDALAAAGFDSSVHHLRLILDTSGKHSSGVAITLEPQQLRSLCVSVHNVLPAFQTLFGRDDVLLMGARCLRGLYLEFDVHRSRLGIASN